MAAFEAAARHQNFTRAAEELSLTHGAVSHAVRGLEAQFGVTLFARTPRGLQLTEQGRALAQRVRLALQLLGDAFSPPEPRRRGVVLLVSAPVTLAARLLLPRLPRLEAELSHLSVRLVTDIGGQADDCDLRIQVDGPPWATWQNRPLAPEGLVAVASPARLAGGPPPSLAALAEDDLIWDPGSDWRQWFRAQGHEPESLRLIRIGDDPGLAAEAAALGAGVALGRARLVESEIASGRLVELPFPASPCDGYVAAWDPRHRQANAIEAFVAWLAADLAAPPRGLYGPGVPIPISAASGMNR